MLSYSGFEGCISVMWQVFWTVPGCSNMALTYKWILRGTFVENNEIYCESTYSLKMIFGPYTVAQPECKCTFLINHSLPLLRGETDSLSRVIIFIYWSSYFAVIWFLMTVKKSYISINQTDFNNFVLFSDWTLLKLIKSANLLFLLSLQNIFM